jgi:ABC-type dipeptide/oligopeptide/nickel transport system permease subunit
MIGCIYGRICGWMDGWTDECLYGLINGWMGGLVGGWMSVLITSARTIRQI